MWQARQVGRSGTREASVTEFDERSELLEVHAVRHRFVTVPLAVHSSCLSILTFLSPRLLLLKAVMAFLTGVWRTFLGLEYMALALAFLPTLMALRRGEGSFFEGTWALKLSMTATVVPMVRLRRPDWSKVRMVFLRGVLRTLGGGGGRALGAALVMLFLMGVGSDMVGMEAAAGAATGGSTTGAAAVGVSLR